MLPQLNNLRLIPQLIKEPRSSCSHKLPRRGQRPSDHATTAKSNEWEDNRGCERGCQTAAEDFRAEEEILLFGGRCYRAAEELRRGSRFGVLMQMRFSFNWNCENLGYSQGISYTSGTS
ncbi:hypothetical protein M7I_2154 [Glarea lozoyensis 74030]|uniref:Uncharacterized protein n=1 Tax=Glarea lozoyensis (strain ATCC 74030 / MF5533) TaxID=1104152 RepID=H0EI09_GLAL7|nr:hypothetical protein M7I_2154 [Glarea lozoyensis 74030]